METKFNFNECIKIEEEILQCKLRNIRVAIEHRSEKGRAVEYLVMNLIRDFLPKEYGLGTGFIAYHNETIDNIEITSQLDIIIYDALRGGPIINLESCQVFPIESVYGYIEVKTVLNSDLLNQIVKQNNELRKIRNRYYWIPVKSSRTKIKLKLQNDFPSIRAYIFTLETDIKDIISDLEKNIRNSGKETHISGMYIGNKGFFRNYPVDKPDDKNYQKIEHFKDNGLFRFKKALFDGVSRYPRIPQYWVPAIDAYFMKSNELRIMTSTGSATMTSAFINFSSIKHL